ncbi:hypothetical protein NBRC10512_005080 [Rhodotorula toruloides]|uniref:Uncharacterized protein n=1 Tax=Rhodotorula toruloides (strain NP11) TaxID=1130832 RepID=M7WTW4_RHOT1|nr:uncharacterized protein RHTO_06036 [Rhodotorula toruloides NP11]EMS24032.1 hypothetical protein RHTO_06036 [Rhodotorula toruloides NP11]
MSVDDAPIAAVKLPSPSHGTASSDVGPTDGALDSLGTSPAAASPSVKPKGTACEAASHVGDDLTVSASPAPSGSQPLDIAPPSLKLQSSALTNQDQGQAPSSSGSLDQNSAALPLSFGSPPASSPASRSPTPITPTPLSKRKGKEPEQVAEDHDSDSDSAASTSALHASLPSRSPTPTPPPRPAKGKGKAPVDESDESDKSDEQAPVPVRRSPRRSSRRTPISPASITRSDDESISSSDDEPQFSGEDKEVQTPPSSPASRSRDSSAYQVPHTRWTDAEETVLRISRTSKPKKLKKTVAGTVERRPASDVMVDAVGKKEREELYLAGMTGWPR